MNYLVKLNDKIDFSPDSEAKEILQNVRTILTTVIGSVPLHRDFGISWENVDKPLPVAISLMQATVIDAITDFEPRAKVVNVTFEDNAENSMEGVLRPLVEISIGEEE
jgi:phage baseplate assembly protein W